MSAKLTNIEIKNAKPRKKPYRLWDTKGLLILIQPNGGKWWRFKYRFGGTEKMISMGTYPKVSLFEARKRRDIAREQIKNNVNPSTARKIEKQFSKNLSNHKQATFDRDEILDALDAIVSKINDLCEIIRR